MAALKRQVSRRDHSDGRPLRSRLLAGGGPATAPRDREWTARAGINVTETSMATRTARAIPGPKAANKPPDLATIRAPVAAATITAAVRMIGVNRAVAQRAASRPPAPGRQLHAHPGEVEHDVVGPTPSSNAISIGSVSAGTATPNSCPTVSARCSVSTRRLSRRSSDVNGQDRRDQRTGRRSRRSV